MGCDCSKPKNLIENSEKKNEWKSKKKQVLGLEKKIEDVKDLKSVVQDQMENNNLITDHKNKINQIHAQKKKKNNSTQRRPYVHTIFKEDLEEAGNLKTFEINGNFSEGDQKSRHFSEREDSDFYEEQPKLEEISQLNSVDERESNNEKSNKNLKNSKIGSKKSSNKGRIEELIETVRNEDISFTANIMREQERKLLEKQNKNKKENKGKLRISLANEEESISLGGIESPIAKQREMMMTPHNSNTFGITLNRLNLIEEKSSPGPQKKEPLNQYCLTNKKNNHYFVQEDKINDTLPPPNEDSILKGNNTKIRMSKMINDSHFMMLEMNEAEANQKKKMNKSNFNKNIEKMKIDFEDSKPILIGISETDTFFKNKIGSSLGQKDLDFSIAPNNIEKNKNQELELNRKGSIISNSSKSGRDIELKLVAFNLKESDMSDDQQGNAPSISERNGYQSEDESEKKTVDYNNYNETVNMINNQENHSLVEKIKMDNMPEGNDDTIQFADLELSKVQGGGINKNNKSEIDCFKKMFVTKYRERERDFNHEDELPEKILPPSLNLTEKKSKFFKY